MSAHLSIENVCFGYGARQVLRNVSVELKKGDILGLIGPNGAGKSTLIRIVLGLSTPSSGRTLLDGVNIGTMMPKLRARRIAYVPQSSPLSFPATVFETCLLGRTPHMGSTPSRKDLSLVEEMLARLRLEDFAFRPMSELSGGERQRVMLARALAQETDVLVLDEPTSALDIGNQLFTLRVVAEIARERGVTALVAIHDLSLAARFSDSLLLLDKGVVVSHGDWKSTLTEEVVRKVYGVDVEVGLLRGVPVFSPHELA
ncbi:ABC transporter ATP-binding protein [Aminobacter sp. AP02]|uniref:ABC transporter ATP-binding protein n=1 Tax=Aminobacter sp. AP02 TaxID=2135737 RepID=UPI000D6BB650|nr:ABC transporter ATP-binding protein [Aminobacter sp. AP02]PWK65698.1 iron complex transport system ATP-binding protein [Aminobacter sp. AP02]